MLGVGWVWGLEMIPWMLGWKRKDGLYTSGRGYEMVALHT